MWSKLDYIHLNPVRAGLVEKASDYLYSSTINNIKITILNNLVVDVQKPDSFWKSIS
jgi:hypothetical protein